MPKTVLIPDPEFLHLQLSKGMNLFSNLSLQMRGKQGNKDLHDQRITLYGFSLSQCSQAEPTRTKTRCMCPHQRSNRQPWRIGTKLLPTEPRPPTRPPARRHMAATHAVHTAGCSAHASSSKGSTEGEKDARKQCVHNTGRQQSESN